MIFKYLNKQIWLLALIAGGIISCYDIDPTSDPIEVEDIAGKYTAGFGLMENDYIELKDDSTFIHYFKTISGKLYIDTGFWEYIASEKYHQYTLVLDNFKIRYPQWEGCYYNAEAGVFDTMPIRQPYNLYKNKNRISIKFCPSRNQFYTKDLNSSK